MRFQMLTDYSIRLIHYLSKHVGELPTAKTIASETKITYSVFIKIANKLKNDGLIVAVHGRDGGYYLAKPAEEISLYDIVRSIEGDVIINRCLMEDGYCSRNATEYCNVHNIFLKIQSDIRDQLEAVKISDI